MVQDFYTQVVSSELGNESSFFSHSLETPDESVLFEIDPDIPLDWGCGLRSYLRMPMGMGLYNDGETIGGFRTVGWCIQPRQ